MFPHLTVDKLTNRMRVLTVEWPDWFSTNQAAVWVSVVLAPHLFGGYRKHLDIMVTQRLGLALIILTGWAGLATDWIYFYSDLQITRRMYKLDENITTEMIILPRFYIILVIKFFTFYQIFQFT